MPDLSFEESFLLRGISTAGIDEVGRGSLVFDVTVAAVVLPAKPSPALLRLVDDSKRLTRKARMSADAAIRQECLVSIGRAGIEEIASLNIHHATMLAMRRAFDLLDPRPGAALVDGNRRPPIEGCEIVTVVKGDAKSYSIAAASIVAKQHRDAELEDLALLHPEYGWDRNAGYGTAEHLEALKRFGPTPYHRLGFAPVEACLAG